MLYSIDTYLVARCTHYLTFCLLQVNAHTRSRVCPIWSNFRDLPPKKNWSKLSRPPTKKKHMFSIILLFSFIDKDEILWLLKSYSNKMVWDSGKCVQIFTCEKNIIDGFEGFLWGLSTSYSCSKAQVASKMNAYSLEFFKMHWIKSVFGFKLFFKYFVIACISSALEYP